MDRRKFLRGLFGSAVALTAAPILIEEVSRVYSFPTNIVMPRPIVYAYTTWDASGLQERLVLYYNKGFIENLRKNSPMEAMSRRLSLPDASGNQHYLAPATDDGWFDDYED